MRAEPQDQNIAVLDNNPDYYLPIELWSQIFRCLLIPNPNLEQMKDMDHFEMVCTTFRDIVQHEYKTICSAFLYENHNKMLFPCISPTTHSGTINYKLLWKCITRKRDKKSGFDKKLYNKFRRKILNCDNFNNLEQTELKLPQKNNYDILESVINCVLLECWIKPRTLPNNINILLNFASFIIKAGLTNESRFQKYAGSVFFNALILIEEYNFNPESKKILQDEIFSHFRDTEIESVVLSYAYQFRLQHPAILDCILKNIFTSRQWKSKDIVRQLEFMQARKLIHHEESIGFKYHYFIIRYIRHKNKEQHIQDECENASSREALAIQYILTTNPAQRIILNNLIASVLDQESFSSSQLNHVDLRLLLSTQPLLKEIYKTLKKYDLKNLLPNIETNDDFHKEFTSDRNIMEHILSTCAELECGSDRCIEDCMEKSKPPVNIFIDIVLSLRNDEFAKKFINAFVKELDKDDGIVNGTQEKKARKHVAQYLYRNRNENKDRTALVAAHLFQCVFQRKNESIFCQESTKCLDDYFLTEICINKKFKNLYDELITIESIRKLVPKKMGFTWRLYRAYCNSWNDHNLVHQFSLKVMLWYIFLDFLIIFFLFLLPTMAWMVPTLILNFSIFTAMAPSFIPVAFLITAIYAPILGKQIRDAIPDTMRSSSLFQSPSRNNEAKAESEGASQQP